MTDYHVCGVLLMCRSEQAAAVEQRLLGLAGVELHASAGGRLVVTLEGPSYVQTLQQDWGRRQQHFSWVNDIE